MGKFKKLLLLLPTILLVVLIYLSVTLIEKGNTAKIYKSEYATLHSSEFGMFNSDLWTEKIIKIMDTKIENFSIQNAENREEIYQLTENSEETEGLQTQWTDRTN